MAFMSGGGAEAARLVISLAVTNGPAMKALNDVQQRLADVGTNVKNTFGKGFESMMLGFGNIGDAADGIRSVGGAIGSIVGPMIMGAAKMETFAQQFEVLLGSADAAKARMADLSTFAATTPFELPGVVEASRLLQTFTDGALAAGDGLRMVGNIAAGTGKPIEDVAFKVGRMYDAFRSGTNIGESLMYLQEMGAISGASRRKIEDLAKAVQKGSLSMEEAWQQATQEFGKFDGMTEKLANTTEGRLSTAIDAVNMSLAKLGEKLLPIVNQALSAVVPIMDIFTAVADKASKYMFLLTPILLAAAKALLVYAKNQFIAVGAVTAFGMSMKTLWKAVLGPIGLIIAGLELFSMAWENNFLGIKDIVEGVVNWLKDNFGWLFDAIGGIASLLGQVGSAVASAVGKVGAAVTGSGAEVKDWVTTTTTGVEHGSRQVESSMGVIGSAFTRTSWEVSRASDNMSRDIDRTPKAVAAAWAEGKEKISQAAANALNSQEIAARNARLLVMQQQRKTTAEMVAEMMGRRQLLAEAMAGTLDIAAADKIVGLSVKVSKDDITKAKADLSEINSLIKQYSDKRVTAKEAAVLKEKGLTAKQYVDQLQIEKNAANLSLAEAQKSHAEKLIQWAQYGTNEQRVARLNAALTAIRLAAGYSSGDEAVRLSISGLLTPVYTQIAELQGNAYDYGAATVRAYARGLGSAGGLVEDAAGRVLGRAKDGFVAHSPPGPKSPLHKIDVWGFKTGAAWAEGLGAGLGTTDIAGAMPDAGAFSALSTAASPPSSTGAALVGAGSSPYGTAPGAAATGGGLTLQMSFSSAVPYTPAEQDDLGRRVGPAVYEYLRSRGAV